MGWGAGGVAPLLRVAPPKTAECWSCFPLLHHHEHGVTISSTTAGRGSCTRRFVAGLALVGALGAWPAPAALANEEETDEASSWSCRRSP